MIKYMKRVFVCQGNLGHKMRGAMPMFVIGYSLFIMD
jgi:hypothetical protein